VTPPPGIHWADLAVIVAYLSVVVIVGMRAAASKTEEGFLLAGRKLGKVFQFFLNFGNACDANGAVSTASVVYQQGISGIWISFQTVFMNPYYWFMATWFRRARLVTNGDLFEDRFASKSLASFYAVYQTGVAIILIGFGNFVGYKVTSTLLGSTSSRGAWPRPRPTRPFRARSSSSSPAC
jgi:Na+/proline symporter